MTAGLAIELATGLAWLHELRKPNGEWTRTPADKPGTGLDRYVVPDHARLINPRADYPDPADHPFFKKHPVSVQNIIDAYDATPPEHRIAGMRWYSDAHLLARAMGMLGGGHGGDPDRQAELGAILLGNYSNSADWPINMWRAARAAEENKPIPKGEGYVSGDMVKKAQKALDGMSIDQVLVSPKTRSFAHLLAQGDDSPDDPYGHVVIDAHALNVATGGVGRGLTYRAGHLKVGGKRVNPPLEDSPPISTDVRAHEYVGDLYREAAKIVSKRDGVLIKPHQMQAVTWVGQVLANQAADRAAMESETGGVLGRAKGRIANEVKDWKTWLAYAKAHQFQLVPGVSALANDLAYQVLEMAGEGSIFAQAFDLAYNPHQPRGPDGRWIKAGGIAAQALTPEGIMRAEGSREPATHGDLRTAVIDSKIYTARQFDAMQRQIEHLQHEIDTGKHDEARAVLVTHLAWIGAGIAVAVGLTLVGVPVPVVLLAGMVPALGQELSELGVVLDHGKRFFAHPAKGFQVAIHQGPMAALGMAADGGLHSRATAYLLDVMRATGYTGSQGPQIAAALVSQWMDDNAARLAHATSGIEAAGGLVAQVIELDFNPAEPRDPKGRWTKGSLAHRMLDPFYNEVPETQGTSRTKGTYGGPIGRDLEDAARLRAYRRQHPVARPITAAEARGDSRPVSYDEFQAIAAQGLNQLAGLSRRTGTDGLDQHWEEIKGKTWPKVQEPWGGATIDTETGQPLESDADRYALSVKPAGLHTVSVPETASEQEFRAAMDRARAEFGDELAKGQRYLGVFHDDDNRRIDIDPVLVVDSVPEVEAIGAYTHAVGGAYHFRSGDGFWPPHVGDDQVQMADEDRVHFAGPGQWRSQADAAQDGLSPEQEAEIEDASYETVVGITEQILAITDLAFNPAERRDSHGRWTRDEVADLVKRLQAARITPPPRQRTRPPPARPKADHRVAANDAAFGQQMAGRDITGTQLLGMYPPRQQETPADYRERLATVLSYRPPARHPVTGQQLTLEGMPDLPSTPARRSADMRQALDAGIASNSEFDSKPGEDITFEQGENENYFGNTADTDIVDFADGSVWVRKRGIPRDSMDREVAYSLIGQVFGTGSPSAMIRPDTKTGRDALWMEHVGGVTAIEWTGGYDPDEPSEEELETGFGEFPPDGADPYDMWTSPQGERIGLADKVTVIGERHMGNWMVDGGKPVPIDNESASFEAYVPFTGSPFSENLNLQGFGRDTTYEMWDQWADGLEGLRPAFEAMNHGDWLDNAIGNFEQLRIVAGHA